LFAGANGRVADSFTSIHDAPLHHTGGRGKGKDAAELAAPPDAVLAEIDQQELNRMFVRRYVTDNQLSLSVALSELLSELSWCRSETSMLDTAGIST